VARDERPMNAIAVALCVCVACVSASAPPTMVPLAELAAAADETLFENILGNQHHVLHQLLPQTERNQPTTFAQENMTVHLL